MSDFQNTIELLGESVVLKSIVEGTITEFNDDVIKTLGQYAFCRCTKLTSVNCPNVEILGYYNVFEGCTSLLNVNLPKIKSVAQESFSNCYALQSVNFPEVTSIGTVGFRNCFRLSNIVLPKLSTIGKEGLSAGYNNRNNATLTNVNFPLLTSIGQQAFTYQTKLATVDFPLVTNISTEAFLGCWALEWVDFGKLTSLGASAFSSCTVLKTVILRNNAVCTLSNTNAFSGTPFASGKAGGTLLVPSALVESYKTATNWSVIWGYGHNRFLALEDYTVDGTTTGAIDWSLFSVTRGILNRNIKEYSDETVTSAGDYAFYACESMTSVNMPSVTNIGNNAFQYCLSMTSVNMPSVTSIDSRAFQYCYVLTSVNMPSVTNIGDYVFHKCSKLESVYLPATPPKLVSVNSFTDIKSDCKFYIPTGSLGAYQSATNWSSLTSTYSFIEEER